MTDSQNTYLALGDSMSIDYYTGVEGGGAVRQFYTTLGHGWRLVDRTCDGCMIKEVPTADTANLITLTIGGNDAVEVLDEPTREKIAGIIVAHGKLLGNIRRQNPDSCFIVGNVYAPDLPLTSLLLNLLTILNEGIAENVNNAQGQLADIHTAFLGHEREYLCRQIEPTFAGATVIAALFAGQYRQWLRANGQ